MWQRLRDYWLPWVLFAGSLFIAGGLLASVFLVPAFVDSLPAHPLCRLYANDATVRRTSVASAVGLIATAFIFFRPHSSVLTRKQGTKKPTHDNMAGA